MSKDLFSCRNKTAVVVGGSGLIGSELARGLASQGADVFIADVCPPRRPRKGTFVCIDITSEDAVREAMASVIRGKGHIDVLVNCAYPRTKDWGLKLEKTKFNSWKKNVDDHMGGYFLCCKVAAEHMKKQRSGSIINISSIYGIVAPDFSVYEGTDMTMPVAYSAIKAGINGLTRYLATYYARYHIRVNAVAPGGILTNQHEQFIRRYESKTPLGRMGTPGDITGAVVFLASDASSYITGQIIPVDGGWTAW